LFSRIKWGKAMNLMRDDSALKRLGCCGLHTSLKFRYFPLAFGSVLQRSFCHGLLRFFERPYDVSADVDEDDDGDFASVEEARGSDGSSDMARSARRTVDRTRKE